jgi:hypothetical protein
MTDDLERRLRAVEGVTTCWYRNPDGPEAANVIARLRAENARLREALDALRLQALQSDLNNPANEWGWEALQLANAALKGPSHDRS